MEKTEVVTLNQDGTKRRSCREEGEEENAYKNLTRRDHMGDLGRDGKIILK
jgi:hypothetical protein